MSDAAHLTIADQIRAHMRQHMFVVFDLDGTLALTEHRAHFLSGARKNWRAFYDACDQDGPSRPIIQTLLALSADGNEVEIWSGRSDEVREKTTAWLKRTGSATTQSAPARRAITAPTPWSKPNGSTRGGRRISCSTTELRLFRCGGRTASSAAKSHREISDANRFWKLTLSTRSSLSACVQRRCPHGMRGRARA